jgi:hypothetical protein
MSLEMDFLLPASLLRSSLSSSSDWSCPACTVFLDQSLLDMSTNPAISVQADEFAGTKLRYKVCLGPDGDC